MAKVVLVDNFNREHIEDKLLKEELTDAEAESLAQEYNSSHPSNWDYYAVAKPDEYKLWRGVAEFA